MSKNPIPVIEAVPLQPFPTTDVYELEDRVFKLLGRRKPTEVPLDMIFGPLPYFLFTASALVVVAAVDLAASGFPGITGFGWFGLGLWLLAALFVPTRLVLQAVRNSHGRRH